VMVRRTKSEIRRRPKPVARLPYARHDPPTAMTWPP
jgi:hypothetical protein